MNNNARNRVTEHNEILKTYYTRYLTEIRKVSQTSVKHYLGALNNISKRCREKNLVKKDIYEITDLKQLNDVRTIVFADPSFIEINERGRRMYSASLNNYYRFASGEEFQEAKGQISLLDIPIKKKECKSVGNNLWARSEIIKNQAIESVDYTCEINGRHETFIAESTLKPYMEGHHALPMHLQSYFDYSLDIYANIICLCPICHRKIHYGIKSERNMMLDKIYYDRSDRLANSGIHLSKDEFIGWTYR